LPDGNSGAEAEGGFASGNNIHIAVDQQSRPHARFAEQCEERLVIWFAFIHPKLGKTVSEFEHAGIGASSDRDQLWDSARWKYDGLNEGQGLPLFRFKLKANINVISNYVWKSGESPPPFL
jgi:hypothetical protein